MAPSQVGVSEAISKTPIHVFAPATALQMCHSPVVRSGSVDEPQPAAPGASGTPPVPASLGAPPLALNSPAAPPSFALPPAAPTGPLCPPEPASSPTPTARAPPAPLTDASPASPASAAGGTFLRSELLQLATTTLKSNAPSAMKRSGFLAKRPLYPKSDSAVIDAQASEDLRGTLLDARRASLCLFCRSKMEDVGSPPPRSERVKGFGKPAVFLQDLSQLFG